MPPHQWRRQTPKDNQHLLLPLLLHLLLYGWRLHNRLMFDQGDLFKPWLLLIMQLIGYGITFLTYAGTRLQWLAIFLFILSISFLAPRKHILNVRATITLILIGWIGSILFFKTIYAEQEVRDYSAYLPYRFFWE